MTASELVYPVAVSLSSVIFGTLFKWQLDENLSQIGPNYENRLGRAWYRNFFLGPDFCIMALALMAASEIMTNLFASHQVPNHLGSSAYSYFWAFMFVDLASLVLIANLWRGTPSEAKAFLVSPRQIPVPNQHGSGTDTITRYQVHVIRGIFMCHYGRLNLLFSNLLGLATVALFALYIYASFVVKPLWLP